jgi:uncharacterized protein YcbX
VNRLTRITRHPIKGHGREDLASVLLIPGACLPWDRHWAVAHSDACLTDGWNRCANFARGAKAPGLMAITSTLNEATGEVVLSHPDRGVITFRPDDAADLPRFLDWVLPLNPPDRARPDRIVSMGLGLTDSDFPSVSLLSEASLSALSQAMGTPLSPDRFRGNLWIDGAAPFAEFDWIGRSLRIGEAVLEIKERITRCLATTVNPSTGQPDADTLGAMERGFGHQDFGVYAVVTNGGLIATDDEWTLA